MFKKIEKIPVPAIPTTLALLTLSNVYGGLGFQGFRGFIQIAAMIFLLIYILKIICFPKTVFTEYKDMRNSSLYAAFTMCWMIIGSYLYEMGFAVGRVIWFAAIFIHLVHLIIFVFRFIILKRSWDTTLPCWFVTLNGIMVSCVTGGAMNARWLLVPITIWGLIAYFSCFPVMVYRIKYKKMERPMIHRQPILLAPVSLCIVSLVNVYEGNPGWLMWILLVLYIGTVVFIVVKLPMFFSYKFYPGFAGMTFPTAIGVVACGKAAGYFGGQGYTALSTFLSQFQGFMLFMATMLAGYVFLKLMSMLFGVKDE